MDPEIKLLAFAVVLAVGTGVIWWRLVTLILRARSPTGIATTADEAGDVPRDLLRARPPVDRTSNS